MDHAGALDDRPEPEHSGVADRDQHATGRHEMGEVRGEMSTPAGGISSPLAAQIARICDTSSVVAGRSWHPPADPALTSASWLRPSRNRHDPPGRTARMSLPVFPRVKPADLDGVSNGRLPDHLLVTVEMPGADTRCHPQFARALRALMHDCRAATGVDLTNVGHYRSFESQVALLRQRYVRGAAGTRFWDGSWWRRVSGAPVATPGHSDHGWGLAIDGAVWDHGAGRAVAVHGSAGMAVDP